MKPQAVARGIANLTLTRKATDVLLMDLRGLTSMADYFVVCSADSDIQVKAIADAVTDGTSTIGVEAWHREGLSQRQWVLIDYVDVVVHVFHEQTRALYDLDGLWLDARRIPVVDTAPPTASSSPKPTAKK